MILGSSITAVDKGDGRLKAFSGLTTVIKILSLVDDAIAGYDSHGKIIIANGNLAELTGLSRQQLIGMDVSTLFLPLTGVPKTHGRLPFPLDGEETPLLCRKPNQNTWTPVHVRAKEMGDDGSFLMVARPFVEKSVSGDAGAVEPELAVPHLSASDVLIDAAVVPGEDPTPSGIAVSNADLYQSADAPDDSVPNDVVRVIQEIGRAADTGNTSGVHDMLVRELRSAVDADAAALYTAGYGGYVFKSFSGKLGGSSMPTFVEGKNAVVSIASSRGRTASFDRVRQDTGEIALVDSATGKTYEISGAENFPLTSFYVVPIIYNRSTVAVAAVGWTTPHGLGGHSAKVLDILAVHHANDLLTAQALALTSASERVQDVAHENLMHLEELEDKATFLDYCRAFEAMAQAINCRFAPVFRNLHQNTNFIKKADGSLVEFPFTINDLADDRTAPEVYVCPFSHHKELSDWLAQNHIQRDGFVVVVRQLREERRAFLVLSDVSDIPLGNLEITLYKRFVQDVFRQDQLQRQRIQNSLIAHTLQQGMGNHMQHVQGLSAQAVYNSATESANVGGDFYDLLRLENNRACIILGDVAGKGVQAASVSAAVRTALGTYVWEGMEPAHMVRSLNDFFLGFSRLDSFATLFVGLLDVRSGKLTYCSAGHPPAFLLHPKDNQMELLNVQSGVVGAFREMVFKDGIVQLEPGDELVLYTDGVTESRDPSGVFFGETGLRETLVREMDTDVHDMADAIMNTLYDFTGGRLDDDVAIMALRYNGLDDAPEDDSSGLGTEGKGTVPAPSESHQSAQTGASEGEQL